MEAWGENIRPIGSLDAAIRCHAPDRGLRKAALSAVSTDGSTHPLLDAKKEDLPGMDRPDAFVGTNVFVLFDTSNFMYRGFVYAEDAIADFVRGLDRADSVAVYTFSRNLSRAVLETRSRPCEVAAANRINR